jgi:cyclopropane fatty-acyl-phospholipid synthase-like methyltransferase
MSDNAAVKKLFDRTVESYSRNFGGGYSGKEYVFGRRLELAAELAASGKGRLLDCAVGSGEVTAAILVRAEFSHATLVDLSPQMLKHTQGQLSPILASTRCEFVESNIFSFLAERRGGFDFIVCLGLIAHTGRLPELLDLCRANLADGGKILLQSTLAEHWGARVTRWVGRLRDGRRGYRLNYFTTDEITAAARHSGFEVEKLLRYSTGMQIADRFWSRGNFALERRYERAALDRGAEGIFLLRSR